MAFEKLLGDSLIDNKGNKFSAEDLSKNVAVGLYFSAHWCGPCRNFTPQLAKAYTDLKKKGFEIVFVSSDRDTESFKNYHGEMPWLALPYDKRDLKGKLSAKFKVEGIPTLVILDANGKVITKDGREAVTSDPTGIDFPWKPKPFAEAFGSEFIDNKGNKVALADLKKNTAIGIYFSAHWCGPCRQFTPQLAKIYNTIKAADKKFEIVFVSSDRDDNAFKEYHSEMPWLAVPFADRTRANELSTMFGVQGIPTLVIVDPSTGKTINASGRAAVSSDPEGKDFPWLPKAVNELNGGSVSSLNDTPAVIVFAGADDVTQVVAALTAVAGKASEQKGDDEEEATLSFLYAKEHPLVDRVKQLMGYQAGAAVLAILDIPAESVYYSTVFKLSDVTEDSVKKFVGDYKAGLLEKIPLSS